ncbi:MAG: M15 family metallopeptidase [Elusimicrobiaceae bacterium]|nr:M15 family metallopeptidase [Elusimicrobiaceae bacterium]
MKKLLYCSFFVFIVACNVQNKNVEIPQSQKPSYCANFSKEILDLSKQDPYLFYIIDKKHLLPADYNPTDLIGKGKFAVRKQTYEAFNQMAKEAKKDGINLFILSGFRPYKRQEYLFNRSVKTKGQEHADKYVARPGTSQHQLGLAIDISSVEDSFVNSKEYAWLKEKACKYGFSLSFPQGQEEKTGYAFEPWHYRYITPEGCRVQKEYFNDSQVDFLAALNTCLK